jgi:hypothetical protein
MAGGGWFRAYGALAVIGALTMAMVVAGPAATFAANQSDSDQAADTVAGGALSWSATSPATHLGDRYRLVIENADAVEQPVVVRVIIMDHATMTNTPVVDEAFQLAPGEQRELTAVNDYGTANHFSTHLRSETPRLALTVTLIDAAGAETARFTQAAFQVAEVDPRADLKFQLSLALAEFLGMTPIELRDQLSQGMTLAEIAAEHGKSRDELTAVLNAAIDEWLAGRIADGALSERQAAAIRTRLLANLDTQIDRPLPIASSSPDGMDDMGADQHRHQDGN